MRGILILSYGSGMTWKPILMAIGGLVAFTLAPAVAADAKDAPKCFGRHATIVGTAGDDRLVGLGDARDVIYGGGGDDYILGGDFYEGGDASDLLCGGAGADRVIGSPGDDKLSGGLGKDYVDGGNGADLELGNSGDDRVGKGSFADADSANDVTSGGPGNDLVLGGWGQDKLYGGRGADEVIDLECDGPTLLSGGPGNDYLESWSSSFEGYSDACDYGIADRVIGGDGTDTAKTDELDIVTTVESLTRVTQPNP